MSASTEKKNRRLARENGLDRWEVAAAEEAEKKAAERRKWTIGLIATFLLFLLAILPNISAFYTDTTAVKVGDRSYSPAEVNYYYATEYYNFVNTYGQYAAYFGLDTSSGIAGLKGQQYTEDQSWRDYFLDLAIEDIKEQSVFLDYAEANGITAGEEDLAEVESALAQNEAMALAYGFKSVKLFYEGNYGKGVNADVVRQCAINGIVANAAREALAGSFEHTDAELDEYYAGLGGAYDMFTYAYYLVEAEVAEGADAPTEDALKAAEAAANQIADAYRTAEGEDCEAKLDAAVQAAYPESACTLDEAVRGSSLDGAYAEWLEDAARREGDVSTASTDSGCYVVVFINRNDNSYNTVSVRHILVMAEAGEDGTWSDEALDAAKTRAEEILAEWKAGEATEESFAALAEQYSEDGGSNTNGGLYEDVADGQMVEEFNNFCFNEGHKPGDTGIVYGSNGGYAGYHVMYYVGEGELYSRSLARADMDNEAMSAWLAEQLSALEVAKKGFMKFAGK